MHTTHPFRPPGLAATCVVALSIVLALPAELPAAGDQPGWPQILGPKRDGTSTEKLPEAFPEGGPTLRWRAKVGQGFAGPAVAEGRVFLFDRADESERLRAFASADGAPLFSQSLPEGYRGGMLADHGPRAVPTVADGRVFALGAGGRLRAVRTDTGELLWQKDLADAYRAQDGYFGFGSSPLVDGRQVIVLAGGKQGSIVAFDVATGDERWRAGDDGASYSSPILAQAAGRRQLVVASRLFVQSLDPASGRAYWQQPWGQRGPSVVAALPLDAGNGRLFFTASYGVGALLLAVGPGSVETVWEHDDRLSSQYATPVLVDGRLYGSHGREDRGEADYRAVELETGRVLWSKEGFGIAHTLTDGERLLIQRLDGALVLARARPERLDTLDRWPGLAQRTRALPAWTGGTLYVRTTAASGAALGGELLAVELVEQR